MKRWTTPAARRRQLRPHQLIVSVTGVLLVALFYSNLASYAQSSGMTGITPALLILGFAGVAFFASVLRPAETVSRTLTSPLLLWCVGYAVISVAGFLMSTQVQTASDILQRRLLSILFVATCFLTFGTSESRRVARVAIALGVAVAVGLNIVDWFEPLTFSTANGRSAGLYVNPNISGAALIVGMIVLLEDLRPSLRPWVVLITGLGVVLTFSRGALVGWVAVALVMMVRRRLPVRMFAGAAVLTVGVIAFSAIRSTYLGDTLNTAIMSRPDLVGRMFIQGDNTGDENTDVRIEVATAAWRVFMQHPFMGAGLGATTEWDQSQGTHNTLLMHLAEHGFLGATILASLVYLLIKDRTRRDGRVELAIFLVIWNFFSHNVLDEFPLLLCITWFAAIAPARLPVLRRQPVLMRQMAEPLRQH